MVGGTLRRCKRIRFCLWIRTYFGHLTNLVRSLTGWISPPILKFLGDFLKSEDFASFAVAFPTTTFFPLTAFLT